MTPPISRGLQSPVVISCPCPALSEDMVVVKRVSLEKLLKDTWDHFGKSYIKDLWIALGKKP